MIRRGDDLKKRILPTIGKICLFIIIANLPFLTISSLIGVDTFLDSFQHPIMYQYLKNDGKTIPDIGKTYILIQRSPTPGCAVEQGDTILYRTVEGTVRCEPVLQVQYYKGIIFYYTSGPQGSDKDGPIYNSQVLGKVVCTLDDSPWNAISLYIWGLSKADLNIFTLFQGN
jgi:hypothetical protein